MDNEDANNAQDLRKKTHRINLVWEITQAILALMLIGGVVFVSVYGALHGDGGDRVVPETLKAAAFVVLGFYFGRTNHARPNK